MSPRQIIPFKISSMDSLGQGVSKATDKVTFISKTTVGDEGEAVVTAEKKGVAFAQLKSLTVSSPNRQNPPCPHFDQCPSCHYQHIPYEQELRFKQEALEKLFFKLEPPPLEVIGAPRRLEYRNRVQLHYDLVQKKLGMLDARSHVIVPIPDCMVGLPEVNREMIRLYTHGAWLKEAPKSPARGHVELYWFQGKLHVSWNRPYADGGFTQVFEEMNLRLKDELTQWFRGQEPAPLLDLFGGNGNLSDGLNHSQRLCVDLYHKLPGKDFVSQDLYEERALDSITRELTKRELKPEWLLLDPPRSGLKNLREWIEALRPKSVAYVSCDPHTLARDVAALNDYTISRAFLIDFFPSTFHFETMLFLRKKS